MHDQIVSLEDVCNMKGQPFINSDLLILCDFLDPSHVLFFGSSVKVIVLCLVDRVVPKIIICFVISGSRDIVLIFLISLFRSAVIYTS